MRDSLLPRRSAVSCRVRGAVGLTLPLALLALTSGCATAHVTRGGIEVQTFTHASTNAHLVRAAGAVFLVDSGYAGDAEALAKDLEAAGVAPASLKAIILTHGHADHAAGARLFQQRFHVPIVVGAGDQDLLAAGANVVPTNTRICPNGFIARLRSSEDGAATYAPFTADVVVPMTGPQDLAPLTGIPGRLLPVPGHTNGSLVVEVGEVVLVGDLLRGGVVGGGAETHLYMCDLDANRRDIRRLLELDAPKAQLVFVGHFGPLTREAVLEHFPTDAKP